MQYEEHVNADNFEKKSLSDIVTIYVKSMILSGQFKGGDKLVENDICEKLNVSRAPVRESLRELSIQNILSFSPRKGCQVVEASKEELLEVFSIRSTLEMQIINIIYDKKLLKDKDFECLYEMIDKMMQYHNKPMEKRDRAYVLNTLDINFHSYLWELSGSKRRAQLLDGLFIQLLISMNKDVATLGSFREKAVEHKKIIDAFKEGTKEVVLDAFLEHMKMYIDSISYFDNM